MKYTYLVATLLLSLSLQAQINQAGYPLHRYYTPEEYGSDLQNWDAVVDKNGLLYVANNFGLLQYDGFEWRNLDLNEMVVFSLALDKRGVIFLGGGNEMGYLLPNNRGELIYTSLMPKLNKESSGFSYVYKVNIIDDTVYFSTDNQLLFKYNIPNDTIVKVKLPEYSLFTFEAGNEIYGGSYSSGLFKLVYNKIKIVESENFYEKNIFSIQESDKDSIFYVVTGNAGIYEFYPKTGESKLISSIQINELSQKARFYSSLLDKGKFYNATLGAGVVIMNTQGKLISIFDEEIGIQDHLCTNVIKFKNSPVLWATLNIGLAAIEVDNPFRFFSKESKLDGAVNDIRKIKNKLYVVTDLGLYYLPEKYLGKPEFRKVEGIEQMIWSIEETEDSHFFLVGTNNGIFEVNINNHQITSVEDKMDGINNLFEIKKKEAKYRLTDVRLKYSNDNNILWAGSKSRLIGIKHKNNQWIVDDLVFNIGDRVVSMAEDRQGLWASTSQSGLVYLKKQLNGNYKMHQYDTTHGLPVNYSLRLASFNHNIIVLTTQGVYAFDSITQRFSPHKKFPKQYVDGDYQMKRFLQISDSSLVMSFLDGERSRVERLTRTEESFIIEDKPFKRIKQFSPEVIYKDEDHLWFGVSNILYSYDLNNSRNFNEPFNCLVRKVEGRDTVYFHGQFYNDTPWGLIPSDKQHKKQIPVLEYRANDLTIHFASPFFEGNEEIEYSHKLEGYKKNWSKWSKEPKAVFTNLNEGDYTFKVKAKNIYGTESSVANYSFSVLPPWYRTLVAYGFYFVALFCLIWVIVKLYTRKLKREKIRLEGIVRERTAEIREQRDEIQAQKQSIEDSILYASRIQNAILPSEELAADLLPEHFILFRPRDIVSGDYYWLNKIDNKTIVVAADCTGHGVPGAFMSMLGVSFLNEIVLKERILEPHEILNRLRRMVKRTLKQEGKEGEAKDGMDIALVIIDENTHKLYYAGAYNPVYIFRDGELNEIKADRMPIGIYIREKESFTLNEYEYQKGDTFYIFSDGYPDQFGGEKGQKFRSKAMKNLLAQIQGKSMEEQKNILEKTIIDWMRDEYDQIDDMVMIGVKL